MNTKTKGAAQLSDPAEEMRLQVVELELRARYWKAQHDIRYYTLEAEKVQPEYDKWLADQKVKNEEAQKAFEEQLKKMQDQGADVAVDGQILEPETKVE